MTARVLPSRCLAVLLAGALMAAACSNNPGPELVRAPATPTPQPVASPTPLPTPEPTVAPTPTTGPTPTPTPVQIQGLARGVSDDVVGVAVIKTGLVFGDVEVGVRARLDRLNSAGGVAGRQVRLVSVVDDRGDPELALEAAQQLVDDGEVFAIVLATASPQPALTDFLAQSLVPFVGWGFAPGFCLPNDWGFGFNGCLNGSVLGVAGAVPDTSARDLTTVFFERPATAVLVTTDDAAGRAATAQATVAWGEQLLDVVLVDESVEGSFGSTSEALVAASPEIALLSVGLDLTIALKDRLGDTFDGMVLDDVGYLPGLLGDFPTAEKLEGGYSVTQFPPQEEYREVTGVLSTDLQGVGGDLIYSQAVSLGYWSTDLLIALLVAVGPDLNTASFHQAVNVDGVDYRPDLIGAPCPLNTRDIHRLPTGGGALVRVEGGIYRPVVEFTCFGEG